ncbi:hypothetical protein EV178_005638 [Coemansia sp. RSA 1646]|nr:hypothetical protein EV178_005638 [Coemansia sp. RSA 1646]KAJ2090129.1 hypothetical protein IW138_002939 [Coemansia sp. RSA 986]
MAAATTTAGVVDIKADENGCTIPLPFGGSIVVARLPFFLSLPLWGKMTKTHMHEPTPLPPPAHALTTLPVCDASGTEFYPSDCIPPAQSSEALAKRGIPDPLDTAPYRYRDDEEMPWAEQDSEFDGLDTRARSMAGGTSEEEYEESYGWTGGIHYPAETPALPVPRNDYTEEYNECVTGMMRCTSGRRAFDTCVHGKWGTIRKCPQGTKCAPVPEDSIVCA